MSSLTLSPATLAAFREFRIHQQHTWHDVPTEEFMSRLPDVNDTSCWIEFFAWYVIRDYQAAKQLFAEIRETVFVSFEQLVRVKKFRHTRGRNIAHLFEDRLGGFECYMIHGINDSEDLAMYMVRWPPEFDNVKEYAVLVEKCSELEPDPMYLIGLVGAHYMEPGWYPRDRLYDLTQCLAGYLQTSTDNSIITWHEAYRYLVETLPETDPMIMLLRQICLEKLRSVVTSKNPFTPPAPS